MVNKKEESDPNTLRVQVADSVGVAELHPGSGEDKNTDTKVNSESKEETREELLKKLTERKVALAEKYVKPHNIKARWVTPADLERVIKDADTMFEMCLVGRGEYTNVHAIAHTQICDKDPLRFYVSYTMEMNSSGQPVPRGLIIVNPVILSTHGAVEGHPEGCMSYPEEPLKTVFRYDQATLEYQTIGTRVNKKTDEVIGGSFLSHRSKMNLYGLDARVTQHECAHLNGFNIYDESNRVDSCVGGKPEKVDEPIVESTTEGHGQ